MNEINIDILFADFKNNFLSYLLLLGNEFTEVLQFVNELLNLDDFVQDPRDLNSTVIQKSLNISVVISYARNFKTNYGFNYARDINKHIIQDFSNIELEIHKKLINLRDKEFAHSDSDAHDFQIYNNDPFSHSHKVVRMFLDKNELATLKSMIIKINTRILDLKNIVAIKTT